MSYTTPIFSADGELLHSLGTGSYIELARHRLLLTNAHVLEAFAAQREERSSATFEICAGSSLPLIEAEYPRYWQKSDKKLDHRFDDRDVGFADLAKLNRDLATTSVIFQKRFLEVSGMDTSPLNPGDTIMFCGFPTGSVEPHLNSRPSPSICVTFQPFVKHVLEVTDRLITLDGFENVDEAPDPRGTSGSLIFDADGRARGLLFGGTQKSEFKNKIYVCPIGQVLDTIEALSE